MIVLTWLTRKTAPVPDTAGGLEGQRLRLAECENEDVRAAYARVMRACGSGVEMRDTVPWYQLTPITLLALGALFGVMFGMLVGRASVPRPPTPAERDTALPSRAERADVSLLPTCEDERPGATWESLL